MDCNSIVKIRFRSPHGYRNSEALKHLIGAVANYMTTHDPFVVAHGDELHHRLRLDLQSRPMHRCGELAVED